MRVTKGFDFHSYLWILIQVLCLIKVIISCAITCYLMTKLGLPIKIIVVNGFTVSIRGI